MAQHDFVISNGSGKAVREDIDSALKALVSNNSGNDEPWPTYAHQFWADTNAGLLKIRNANNNAWITLRGLDGSLSVTGNGVYITAVAPSATIGNVYLVPASPGQARFHLYNGGFQAEWLFGQKSSTDHSFKISKSVGGVETDYFAIDSDGTLRVPNLNGGPLAGFRNLLINANPIINQRGYVSGTATGGAYQYTLDRWSVVTSGQSISWTDAANVRTVTAPAGGVEQVIEGASILSGTYTLNWTGTATAIVAGNAVAKGGTVTLTGGTNTTVRFSGGTFSLPQLEPGPVATPFEQRPIGTELSLCQRYYEVGNGWLGGYAAGPGAGTYHAIAFKVTKRVVPTLTYGVAVAANVSVFDIRNASVNTANWYAEGAGTGQLAWNGTWTASAEL